MSVSMVYRLNLVREPGTFFPIQQIVNSSKEAAAVFADYLKDVDRENFVALALNSQNKIIGINTVSMGSVDSTTVHPREVYKFAILANAISIIVAHNHPSETVIPSESDIELSKRLKQSGDLIGIELLDSLIIGEEGKYYSFKNEGVI